MNFVLFSFCYSCKFSGRAINNIVQSVALVIKPCLSNSETFSHYFCEYFDPGIWVFLFCVVSVAGNGHTVSAAGPRNFIFLSKLSIICTSQCIVKHFFFTTKKLALDLHYKYLSRNFILLFLLQQVLPLNLTFSAFESL